MSLFFFCTSEFILFREAKNLKKVEKTKKKKRQQNENVLLSGNIGFSVNRSISIIESSTRPFGKRCRGWSASFAKTVSFLLAVCIVTIYMHAISRKRCAVYFFRIYLSFLFHSTYLFLPTLMSFSCQNNEHGRKGVHKMCIRARKYIVLYI